MFFTIFHYLRGFLVLRLYGPYIERFVNLCVKNGIYLWGIRKEGEGSAIASVSIPGFFRMREAARKTKTGVRILKKRGLPLFLHRHRHRGAFLAGILLFSLLLAVLTSFIWEIEIDGTESLDKNIIRNALSSCGLSTGVIKYTIEEREIKEEMLRKIPELSWLFVEVKGTCAFVHVREKTPLPEMVPLGTPANISASREGVIVSCTAERGTPLVREGDIVQKGALLISGTVETKHGGTLLVHAKGSVLAKTWYTASDTFPLSRRIETESGLMKTRYMLSALDLDIPLFYKDAPFPTYRLETEEMRAKLWGHLYLPLSLSKHTYYETDVKHVPLSEEEAETFYGQQLLEKLPIPHKAEIINTTFTHILEEDTIKVTCTAECIEEIGVTREILEDTGT